MLDTRFSSSPSALLIHSCCLPLSTGGCAGFVGSEAGAEPADLGVTGLADDGGEGNQTPADDDAPSGLLGCACSARSSRVKAIT